MNLTILLTSKSKINQAKILLMHNAFIPYQFHWLLFGELAKLQVVILFSNIPGQVFFPSILKRGNNYRRETNFVTISIQFYKFEIVLQKYPLKYLVSTVIVIAILCRNNTTGFNILYSQKFNFLFT